MKIIRWVLFAPAFIFYTALPQYYAEKWSRWAWSLTATKDVWWLKAITWLYSIAWPIGIWMTFVFFLSIVLRIPPKRKLGISILILYQFLMTIIAYATGFGLLDKWDVIYDVTVFLCLLVAFRRETEIELANRINGEQIKEAA